MQFAKTPVFPRSIAFRPQCQFARAGPAEFARVSLFSSSLLRIPSRVMERSHLLAREVGVVRVIRPIGRICFDVFANGGQGSLVANNVLVIVALPQPT